MGRYLWCHVTGSDFQVWKSRNKVNAPYAFGLSLQATERREVISLNPNRRFRIAGL